MAQTKQRRRPQTVHLDVSVGRKARLGAFLDSIGPHRPLVDLPTHAEMDAWYTLFQDGARIDWLQRIHRDPSADTYVQLSESFGGDRHPEAKGVQSFAVKFNGDVELTSRFEKTFENAYREAERLSRRFVLIPIRLNRQRSSGVGTSIHSNALLVDRHRSCVHLFEPHGCDPTDKAQNGFRHYYNAEQYYSGVSAILKRVLGKSYDIYTPVHFQPKIFGQSVSNVLEGGHDRWCLLWTSLFYYYVAIELDGDAALFVRAMNDLTERNDLAHFLKRHLAHRHRFHTIG